VGAVVLLDTPRSFRVESWKRWSGAVLTAVLNLAEEAGRYGPSWLKRGWQSLSSGGWRGGLRWLGSSLQGGARTMALRVMNWMPLAMLRFRHASGKNGAVPVAMQYAQPVQRYQPPRLQATVSLLRSRFLLSFGVFERTAGWNQVTSSAVRVVSLPGGHVTSMTRFRSRTGQALRAALEAAEKRT
jgi:hypothetical protein